MIHKSTWKYKILVTIYLLSKYIDTAKHFSNKKKRIVQIRRVTFILELFKMSCYPWFVNVELCVTGFRNIEEIKRPLYFSNAQEKNY